MRAKARITGSLMSVVAAGLGLAATGQADPRPLKVFILAGQSNMEGHASIETSDYHYLGCAKTFALMGQAFAEATLQMMNERQGR